MPDDLSKKRPEDAERINVNQTYELARWARRFRISENELRNLIKRIGSDYVDDVKKELEAK